MKNNDIEITTLTSNVPTKFAQCVKKYHKEFNVKLKEYKDYGQHHNYKTVCVVGKMSDLVLLNDKCEKESYSDLNNK